MSAKRHRHEGNVAVLHRYGFARGRTFPWAYCEDHLYGRRIEGDQVLHEVPAGSPAAERGWFLIQRGVGYGR